MTTWSSSVVIQPNVIATDGGEGAFYALSPLGRLPIPAQNELGTYFVLTTGTGEAIVYQSGGVTLY